MSDKTFGGLIDDRIDYLIQQMPTNQEVLILKSYDEGYFVDIQIKDSQTIIKYVPSNVPGKTGDNGVLVFLNGDINKPFCILGGADLSNYYTKSEVDDLITGDKDLEDYVKKADVRLKFDLEDNGTMIIGIDVGDGF